LRLPSQLFHNLRHFSGQAKERAATQRLGITAKVCGSLHLPPTPMLRERSLSGDRHPAGKCRLQHDDAETDHYKEGGEDDRMRALATVVEDSFHRRLAELYASYHPTDLHYNVFSQLQPAIIWAEEMLSEHATAPSLSPSEGEGPR